MNIESLNECIAHLDGARQALRLDGDKAEALNRIAKAKLVLAQHEADQPHAQSLNMSPERVQKVEQIEPIARPSRQPSYEDQLALVESMMTCYDTPLTQAAGYVRDLLKTIIALQKHEIPLVDIKGLFAALRELLKEHSYVADWRGEHVVEFDIADADLLRAIQPYLREQKQESGEDDTPIVVIKTTDLHAHVDKRRGRVRVQFAFYEQHAGEKRNSIEGHQS